MISRGDVYYADLSGASGREQSGVRPVVVIQGDIGNTHSPTITVAPVTSRIREHELPVHVLLPRNETGMKMDSVVQLEQVRTIDKARLLNKINVLSNNYMKIMHERRCAFLILCKVHKYNTVCKYEGMSKIIMRNNLQIKIRSPTTK